MLSHRHTTLCCILSGDVLTHVDLKNLVVFAFLMGHETIFGTLTSYNIVLCYKKSITWGCGLVV